MKKRAVLQSLLILFPILAVALATTPDSVTVFDTVTKQVQVFSYFDLIPESNLQMLPPLAALSSAVSGILAAVYLGKKKQAFLKGTGYAAVTSATLAAIPVVMQNQIMVIPNVGLPIFMVMQFGVSYYLQKKELEVPQKIEGKRLSKRK